MKSKFRSSVGYLLLSFLFSSSIAVAQDPYFSQFTRIAATYNPAMTGMYKGTLRAGTLYQDHLGLTSAAIRKGILHASFGKDIKLQGGGTDRFGIGGGFIYDDFNAGAFSNNSLFVAAAYQKSLDEKDKHKISLGLQLHYSSRIIDYSRLSFGTQFLEGYYDHTINTNEFLGIQSVDYLDVQLGVQYFLKTNFFKLNAGVGVFHVNQPESTQIANFRIPYTLTANLGYEMWFFNDRSLYIDMYYRYKNLLIPYYGVFARYTAINLANYFKSLTSTHLMVGLTVNSNLLVSPYIGVKSNQIDLGLSFDIKVGSFDLVSYPFESFLEFFFSYTVQKKSDKQKHIGNTLK